MVFPPTDVSITTLGQPLSAGTTYVLSCEAAGSRPDPVISWWLASSLMDEDKMQIVEKVKEVTRSTIYFTPSTADHGKLVACRAENPQMVNSGIDDSWSLTVYCESHRHQRENYSSFYRSLDPPRIQLNFGVNLDGDNIKEGQDVFFRCEVEANPKAYKIGWKHQVGPNLDNNDLYKLETNWRQTLISQIIDCSESERGARHQPGSSHYGEQSRPPESQQGPGGGLQLPRQQPRGGLHLPGHQHPDQM